MCAGVSSAARRKLVAMLCKFSGTEMRCLPPLVVCQNFAIPGSPLLPMHSRFGRCGIFPLIFWDRCGIFPVRNFPLRKKPCTEPPPPRVGYGTVSQCLVDVPKLMCCTANQVQISCGEGAVRIGEKSIITLHDNFSLPFHYTQRRIAHGCGSVSVLIS